PGGDKPMYGLNDDRQKVMNDAIATLKNAGAVIVDPADIPSIIDKDASNNLLLWDVCTDMDEVKQHKCSIDLAYGMERDFNAWIKTMGANAPVKSLTELREWNRKHEKA